MDEQLSALANVFLATQGKDDVARRAATNYLADNEATPGFTVALMRLADADTADHNVRLQAAAHLKNVIRRNWNEPEPAVIPAEDRAVIKEHIVNLMAKVPPKVQQSVAAALAIIAQRDFPGEWDGLLPDLVARLASPDLHMVTGVLETANSIFERFREAEDNDATRTVLRLCLDSFEGPLLEVTARFKTRLEEGIAAREPKALLAACVANLRLCTSILHSLCSIALPDVVEDHMREWMEVIFHHFLTFSCEDVQAHPEDIMPGPLEALQATILDLIAFFADRYDDEFEPYFETFAVDSWKLLTGAGAERIVSQSMDVLVTKAVKFLSTSIAKSQHTEFFKTNGVLKPLCESVVVPNITLREADVITFEENPADFVQQDIEGGDNDTRRRVASDLVRAMGRHFAEEVTTVLLEIINGLFAAYDADKTGRYLSKDAAIALLMSVTVKGATVASGVTDLNPAVDLAGHLSAHIIPELSVTDAAINELPIVKAACLKFVATFRSQFSNDQLVALLPMLIPFVGSTNVVVHTYAAAAIERLLMVKDKTTTTDATGLVISTTTTPRLSPEAVAANLEALFGAFFGLMVKTDYPENEYVMKALMRVVAFCKELVAPYTPAIIESLSTILLRICSKPDNPHFNHYMFETVAVLMRNVCATNPSAVDAFEGLLFPPFQHVLTNDIMEFLPYVFQLLAELLELRSTPAAGAHNLSAGFQSLLPPLLVKELWVRPGNVPALTTLLQAYLRKGSVFIASSGSVDHVLGIWQKLFSTPNQDQYAFALLDAMFEGMALDSFAPYMPTLMKMVVEHLFRTKAAKLARLFTHSSAILMGFHGGAVFEQLMEAIQPGLTVQIAANVLAAMGRTIAGKDARKDTAVGFVRLMSESAAVMGDDATLSAVIASVVELVEPTVHPGDGSAHAFVEKDALDKVDDVVQQEYSAAYSRLIFAVPPSRFAFPAVEDLRQYAGQALLRVSAANPGLLPRALAESVVATTVQSYAAAAGGTIS